MTVKDWPFGSKAKALHALRTMLPDDIVEDVTLEKVLVSTDMARLLNHELFVLEVQPYEVGNKSC